MGQEPTSAPAPSELETLWAGEQCRTVLETLMEFVPGVVLIVAAPDARVLYVSEFASRLVGRPRRELENVPYERHAAVFPAFAPGGRAYAPDERPEIRSLAGEVVNGFEGVVPDAAGASLYLTCNSAPIRNARGEVIGAICACTDIRRQKALESDLREQAEHGRALHDELAHRVKNHLQVLSGLIAAETRAAPASTADFARKVMGMMQGLAAVYESIARAGGEAGAHVDARAFLDDVCRPYRTEAIRVEVTAPAGLDLSSERATDCAVLVNEAVCNSYKHAFSGRGGRIDVRLGRSGPGRLRLEIADDGIGRAEPAPDPERCSYGMKIMEIQARRLGGRLEVDDRPGGGTVVSLDVPDQGELV
jgi:two-component sensor histidine kinase